MAKGGRTYNRDAQGRFAGGGGSGGGIRRGAVKPGGGSLKARAAVSRARQKLAAMDPADQSIKGTLSRRSQRAAVTRATRAAAAAIKSSRVRLRVAPRSGVVDRNGKRRGVQRPPVVTPEVMGPGSPGPGRSPRAGRGPRAADRPGSITHTLRSTLRELAQADARLTREIESITGMPIRAPKRKGGAPKLPGASRGSGRVSDTLRDTLRDLAQSDARFYREMEQIIRDATPKLSGGGSGTGRKRVSGGSGSQRRLPGGRKRKSKG